MRCFPSDSITFLSWLAIFTKGPQGLAKSLLYELDIPIAAAAGTQDPKRLKLSAGKAYRNWGWSALRPRHIGIQNMDKKGHPVNHTYFAMPQPCPSLHLRSSTMFFRRPHLSSHLIVNHQAPRQISSGRRFLPLQTSPGTLRHCP